MKRFSTLLTAAAVFFAVQTKAQSINENFNGGVTPLTSNCWKFSNITMDNSTALIEGQSLASKNLGISSVSTPYYDLAGTVSITFKYRLNDKLTGNAVRKIDIGTTDVSGTFTPLATTITLDRTSYNGNSMPAIETYPLTTVAVSGIKRLTVRVDGGQGDGQSYVIIDNLQITGTSPYHYGATPCNTAPVAVNDYFQGASLVAPFSGNVLNNLVSAQPDYDVNGETPFKAAIVSQPAATYGTVSMTADGNFTFTPVVGFTGGTVSFTYQITDNGYDPLPSNTATVYIEYPAAIVTPMPVKLISFAGSITNNKAQLKWSVAENETGKEFQVLRSVDGKNFSEAGLVFINSKAGAESYSFTDAKELEAVTYYKLKIVNKDGSVSYSNVIALKSGTTDAANTLMLLKNPVESTLNFSYTSSATTQSQVTIYSTLGVKVYSSRISSQKGMNTVSLNLDNHLAAGTYILEVMNGSERSVARLVKK